MSVIASEADVEWRPLNVRFGPIADFNSSLIMSAVRAEVAVCWGGTNICDRNQDQHTECGHRELRSYDEEGDIMV